ncbi:uncharacterized protein V2V93DRAFT_368515 [Kockiozyma suomiensis]|uniref:uncharacterized protein n=1 Tax=Kockiozyma suomiensis TaxID=1337062 RepID=UPI003342F827
MSENLKRTVTPKVKDEAASGSLAALSYVDIRNEGSSSSDVDDETVSVGSWVSSGDPTDDEEVDEQGEAQKDTLYTPDKLADLLCVSTIHDQVSHQKAFAAKLNPVTAAVLYAFASFFCLNGPVGFNTRVQLSFSVTKPYNIQYNKFVSIRDVFGYELTHLMFFEYVTAVKHRLPDRISCPMTMKYGEYFPSRIFILKHRH